MTTEPAPVDVLAFGAHPDDIELGMAATVALHVGQGLRVGLCDLTRGEMGTNGTPDGREAEAAAAAGVLGVSWRVNLRLPDRGLAPSPPHVAALVELIRVARPRVVAAPYWHDRHPDHVAASTLVTTAAFDAGLPKVRPGDAWKTDWLVYYFINDASTPSFVVDVSACYEAKRRALACHASQFAPASDGAVDTRLMSPLFRQLIESRDQQFGALAGVRFAEGFVTREPVTRPTLLKTWPGASAP